MRARRTAATPAAAPPPLPPPPPPPPAAPAAARASLLALPEDVLSNITDRLPPNTIPLVLRHLSKDWRQRYLQHTTVLANGSSPLPAWAVVAALARASVAQEKQLIAAVARSGDVEGMQALTTLHWCRGCFVRGFDAAFVAAACIGQLDMLQWMEGHKDILHVPKNTAWDRRQDAIKAAAGGGQVHVLKWLCGPEERAQCWSNEIFELALRSGDIPTIRWVASTVYGGMSRPWRENPADIAARYGCMEALRVLLDRDLYMDKNTLIAAAKGGQLDALQLLVAEGIPWGRDER